MIISFRSRELRDNALNEFISLFEYSANIVDKLKFFLLVLNSSQNVVEFPLQHILRFHGESLEIPLNMRIRMFLLQLMALFLGKK